MEYVQFFPFSTTLYLHCPLPSILLLPVQCRVPSRPCASYFSLFPTPDARSPFPLFWHLSRVRRGEERSWRRGVSVTTPMGAASSLGFRVLSSRIRSGTGRKRRKKRRSRDIFSPADGRHCDSKKPVRSHFISTIVPPGSLSTLQGRVEGEKTPD